MRYATPEAFRAALEDEGVLLTVWAGWWVV